MAFILDLSWARPKDSISPDVDEKSSPLPERGDIHTEEDAIDAGCSCGSVVEDCINSAKGCGLKSQGTHILIKKNV